jgi:sRNA-binding carbon storage regulator CsrA
MLVLTRKKRQTIVIGDPDGGGSWLLITVLEVGRGRVQIGFTTTAVSTATVPIHRGETWAGSGDLSGGLCRAGGQAAIVGNGTASVSGRSDDEPGVLGDPCPAASRPARSMHDIVARSRSRQRSAQPVVMRPADEGCVLAEASRELT